MGFSIYYRSTKEVTSNQMRDIEAHATELNKSRTWLSCEPVSFRTVNGGDHLLGGSKPNLEPHPDDIASAATEDLPDGTVNDLFDVLAQISKEHSVDWEISHDHSPEPIGFIINGVPDATLLDLASSFAGLNEAIADVMGDLGIASEFTQGAEPTPDSSERPNDDDPPPTLRLYTE